ncbi:MAG: hypothetical protein ACI4SF_13935 [Oscillospiraceae bacterium]
MDSKTQIEEMARKYKEEMLKMYKQSGNQAAKTVSPEKSKQPIQPEKPAMPAQPVQPAKPVQPKIQREPSETAKAEEKAAAKLPEKRQTEPHSKFPSPDDILKELTEPAKTPAETGNFQGNYNAKPFSDMNDVLEPRYSGETDETPDESGTGYIKAEVTTGGGAVPIENAVVLITKKDGGKNYLLKMLITDESGSTETVALPTPNASFSETPSPEEKPFADYYISAYAEGFYAENDMEVPVFSGVKSIQPIALIPKASDDSRFMLD